MAKADGGGTKIECAACKDAIVEIILDYGVMQVEFPQLLGIIFEQLRSPHGKSG